MEHLVGLVLHLPADHHRVLLRLVLAAEDQPLRRDAHRQPAQALHLGAVARRRVADVGHRPGERPRGRGGGAGVEERDERRVVEVQGRAGAVHGGGRRLRHGLDLRRRVVHGAHELDVVVGPGVVDEARVHGAVGVDVSRAHRQRRRAAVGPPHVLDGRVGVVHRARRRHHRRPHRGGAPLRVHGLDQRRHPGRVRARHGRAGDDVEAAVQLLAPNGGDADVLRPRGEDERARREHVGFEHRRAARRRAARRVRRHHRRRLRAQDGHPELDRRPGRAAPLDVLQQRGGILRAQYHAGEGEVLGELPERIVGEEQPGARLGALHRENGGAEGVRGVAEHDLVAVSRERRVVVARAEEDEPGARDGARAAWVH
uniref:Uncharacterized protein n=1 Tax=Oryza glumipatula TaxID=40148 RepID=A0A0D9ZZN0_9ORYZ